MTVFGDYARYYNLLYKDKDYGSETAFVLNRLADAGCRPQTLLDLGCGTGRHALELARCGIAVTGVDMSDTMLSMGKAYLITHAVNLQPQLQQGDARTVRLNQSFDAVVSLFHVMSYQTSENDAAALLETAKAHLKPGGLFLFDFWYGPGVLTDPPTERTKVMEDAHARCGREAKPVHRVNDNIVEVHYDVCLTDKANEMTSKLQEVHTMRYWFMPELRYLARQAGFTVTCEGAWMEDSTAGLHTWNAWMLIQK